MGHNPARRRNGAKYASRRDRAKTETFMRSRKAKSRTEKGSVTISESNGELTIKVARERKQNEHDNQDS